MKYHISFLSLSLSTLLITACDGTEEMLGVSTDAAIAARLLKKEINTDPLAVCNDGSPAVYYVRPGANANQNNWIIQLKGGSSCRSWEECNNRNNSSVSSNNYDDTMSIGGIMNSSASRNPLWHDWNHVYVYYCSSDNWAGDSEKACDASLDPTCPLDSNLRWHDGQSIQFRGHRILRAAVEELQRSTLSYVGTQEIQMPDLDEANHVLFSGSSSGAGGMRINLDWLANKLKAKNPVVNVRGINDSAFTFSTTATITASGCDYEIPDSFPANDFAGEPFMDESCVTAAIAAGDPVEMCTDLYYTLGCNPSKTNFYETPFFVQMDLSDETAMRNSGYQFQDPADKAEFVQKELNFLSETLTKTRRDWAHLGVHGIGVFSIDSGSHTALISSEKFLGENSSWRIDGQSYSDTLYNWLTGGTHQHCVSAGQARCF